MKRRTVKRILTYVRPYRAAFAASCASALLYVLFTLLGPVFTGRAIDNILGPGQVDLRGVLYYLALLGISVLLAAASQWVMNVCTRKISSRASNDMRGEAFRVLNRTPLKYIDGHTHGDIISRMVNDADLVAEGLLQGLTQLLPGVATILGTLVVMAVLNPVIALVVVLVTPVSIAFAGFVARRTTGFFKAQSAAQGRLSGFVNEMVAGQSVVKAFGYEDRCFAQFDAISDELYDTGLKSVFYSSVTNPGTRFVNAIVYAAVGVIGAISAIGGSITVGQLSCFLTYANQYTKPFNEVTGVLTQLQTAVASAERLFAVIDEPTERPDAPDALAPTACGGRVTASHVDFAYVPAVPLIEDFNLDVMPGQRIAIVGPTGCGKTTLINLLMRFYEVDRGEIAVDGNSIAKLRRSALRGMYGMVLQETWLKCATVRENIAYGKPDATDEEMYEALETAQAREFVDAKEGGLSYEIEQGGRNLSGGQRQRLTIARALVKKPQILIMDDSASALDFATDAALRKAIAHMDGQMTVFIVSQRAASIMQADKIVVLDDGEIVGLGTHEDLLKDCEVYREIYESQFKRTEEQQAGEAKR